LCDHDVTDGAQTMAGKRNAGAGQECHFNGHCRTQRSLDVP